jgi:hypothetical protein
VPVLCRSNTRGGQAGAHDDCCPHSDLMIATHTIDLQRPAELPLRVIRATRTMFVIVGELIRPRGRLSSLSSKHAIVQ